VRIERWCGWSRKFDESLDLAVFVWYTDTMRQKDKVTTWIDNDLHRRAKVIAAETGRTLRECLDEALRQWLEEQQRRQEHDTG